LGSTVVQGPHFRSRENGTRIDLALTAHGPQLPAIFVAIKSIIHYGYP
jgi:hypothetical protein